MYKVVDEVARLERQHQLTVLRDYERRYGSAARFMVWLDQVRPEGRVPVKAER